MDLKRTLMDLEKDLLEIGVKVRLTSTPRGVEIEGELLADRLVAKVELDKRRIVFAAHFPPRL